MDISQLSDETLNLSGSMKYYREALTHLGASLLVLRDNPQDISVWGLFGYSLGCVKGFMLANPPLFADGPCISGEEQALFLAVASRWGDLVDWYEHPTGDNPFLELPVPDMVAMVALTEALMEEWEGACAEIIQGIASLGNDGNAIPEC